MVSFGGAGEMWPVVTVPPTRPPDPVVQLLHVPEATTTLWLMWELFAITSELLEDVTSCPTRAELFMEMESLAYTSWLNVHELERVTFPWTSRLPAMLLLLLQVKSPFVYRF